MSGQFSQRSYQQEIMDDLDSGGPVMARTLRELDIINRRLGGNKVSIDGISQLISKADLQPGSTLHIADIGCGGGDMLVMIAEWGRKKGYQMKLTGVDANPYVVELAADNTADYSEITYKTQDIFSAAYRSGIYDIVNCSLFTHHFTNSELVDLFSTMHRQSRLGFICNDLHRHWLAYHSIKIITKVFSRSPMVQNDAPLSVLRAFRKHELQELMREAGVETYSLCWKWAFRWQLLAWH